ncbi:MAG: hypothetical protein RML45_16055 [Acetobacteraceae bacterium]|nr:hypothetical protein [Acetobacteraceae bacterium]
MKLIEPLGTGKSALIRLVSRLAEPTVGRIVLGETDVIRLGDRACPAAAGAS